jgi:hypothetical protein
MWERDPTLQETIETAWSHGRPCSSLQDLASKLSTTQQHLKEWSNMNFGNVTRRGNQLRRRLETLWNQTPSLRRDEDIKITAKELDEILHREELMWRQTSRTTWLKEGDRNTRYFHKKATWRQRKNRIKKLKNNSGLWVDKQEEIEKLATSFFKDLYTQDTTVVPNELLN